MNLHHIIKDGRIAKFSFCLRYTPAIFRVLVDKYVNAGADIFPMLEFLNAALPLIKEKNKSINGSDEFKEPFRRYFKQQRYYMFPSFALNVEDTSQGIYVKFESYDNLSNMFFYLDESTEVMRRVLTAFLESDIDAKLLQYTLEQCLEKVQDYVPFD